MWTQTFYPEHYYSSEVCAILSRMPTKPRKPYEPLKPPQPVPPNEDSTLKAYIAYTILSFLFGIGGIILGFSFSEGILVYAFGIFVFIGFVLFLFTREEKQSREKKRIQYEEDCRLYPSRLSEYETAYSNYLEEKTKYESVLSSMTYDSAKLYRKELIGRWRTGRTEPKLLACEEGETSKKGVSEEFFASKLSQLYKTFTDKKISAGNSFYYPDIVIENNGIYVDIEIDEPYVGNDGTPIHYLDDYYGLNESCDKKRNDYITSIGFEVIRFSEEQVFKNHEKCIQFIQSFFKSIDDATGDPDIPMDFVVIKWTKEIAYQWAFHRYRDTYVPAELKKYISTEKTHTYTDEICTFKEEKTITEDTDIDELPF